VAFDYAGLRTSTVLPMIQQFGMAITYRRYTDVFAPTTGTNTRTAVDTSAYGVVTEYRLSEIDGTLVQSGDRKVLSANIQEPRVGDALVIALLVYQIVGVRAVAPAGVAVLYEIQVRA
jgi:hypothetical protein